MNSRLFHLIGVGCKIVNCTQIAKNRKKLLTKKTNKWHWHREITLSQSIDKVGCVKKTKSGHIMTARPSGVLSRYTLPKNISLLTIGSKSTLPKATQIYKGFCEKSLTKCQKFSYLPFLGWKYLKFQFWKSFLISTNQDGSFDTHIGIVT